MKRSIIMSWYVLKCGAYPKEHAQELNLKATLSGGQSFRWSQDENTNEWTGVFSQTVWKLRQNENQLEYKVVGTLLEEESLMKNKKPEEPKAESIFFEKLLISYLRLDLDLAEYYKIWSNKDAVFKSVCKQFYGIRLLRQEPVENVFAFICSQNNHISRISTMVEKLCSHYGKKICEFEGIPYYAFPELETLAQPEVEADLRNLGFGYRAKFIQKSAAQIMERGGEAWLDKLRKMTYMTARAELMTLHGIGPKVADCICLMSLDFLEALPIDTHVYQIAAKHYLPHLRGKKSVTPKMYSEIGDHFRTLYGEMAGWAHTILFCADLKKFQDEDENDTCISKTKRKKVK